MRRAKLNLMRVHHRVKAVINPRPALHGNSKTRTVVTGTRQVKHHFASPVPHLEINRLEPFDDARLEGEAFGLGARQTAVMLGNGGSLVEMRSPVVTGPNVQTRSSAMTPALWCDSWSRIADGGGAEASKTRSSPSSATLTPALVAACRASTALTSGSSSQDSLGQTGLGNLRPHRPQRQRARQKPIVPTTSMRTVRRTNCVRIPSASPVLRPHRPLCVRMADFPSAYRPQLSF